MKETFLTRTIIFAAAVLSLFQAAFGQSTTAAEDGGLAWYFVLGVIVVIAAGGAAFWQMKQRESQTVKKVSKGNGIVYTWKPEDDDAEESGGNEPENGNAPANTKKRSATHPSLEGIDINDVKEKMEWIRFKRLPINRFDSLKSPRPFNALPEDYEEDLLRAIEESDVEFVEDEDTRESALNVLAGYRTRNSVEAIANMATYDVSSSLRSKAVGILADIDHESVFESVILSCADPSREVRAAGARALFKLSFNRTDAWLRLADCADQYRITQAAKAAMEADFVGRSLERLVHKDVSYAGEALALLALLIKAGETDELFDYLVAGENKDIKLALLRVFRIVNDETSIERLRMFVEAESFERDVQDEAQDVAGVLEEAVISEL